MPPQTGRAPELHAWRPRRAHGPGDRNRLAASGVADEDGEDGVRPYTQTVGRAAHSPRSTKRERAPLFGMHSDRGSGGVNTPGHKLP
jgi:hypothetical protein